MQKKSNVNKQTFLANLSRADAHPASHQATTLRQDNRFVYQ